MRGEAMPALTASKNQSMCMPYWYYDNTRPQHSNLASERPRRWSTGRCLPTSSTPCYTRLKKHVLAAAPDGPRRFFSSAPFASCRLIPRTGCAPLVATELTLRLRVDEGSAEISMIFCIRDVIVEIQRQFGGVKHESWSSRYEKWLWRWPRTQIVPGRHAIECEDGLLQPREQRCDSTARQPVNVERRDFDAGGGGCHRPARLRRKRGHSSDGAELADVFTATGIYAARTPLVLP